jgi:hypothetical protein
LTCKKALPLLLANNEVNIESSTEVLPPKILQFNNALTRWPNNIERLTMFDITSWKVPSLPQFAYG